MCNRVGSTHATNWFRSWKQKYPKRRREGAVGVDGERDEQTTNDERKFVTWRANFTGIQDQLAEDAVLRTTKRQLLQYFLSGILWVREYCLGAEKLAAGFRLKTSATTTVQGRPSLRAAWVQETSLIRELIL